MLANVESFYAGLIVQGARHREAELRAYLAVNGNEHEVRNAASCSFRALVAMAKRRLSFKKRGNSIEAMFMLVLGVRPWPSDSVKDVILDFVVLRQMVAHNSSADISEGADQGALVAPLRRADLLRSNTYGDLAVHRPDYVRVLHFIREVMEAMTKQIDHLRSGIAINFGSM